MDKPRQMRITVNKSEVTLIKKLHGTAEADCPACQMRVEMATPEQAVTLTGIHARVIYGWVERERVHFIETAEGHLLICLDSLRAAYENSLRETQERVSPYRRLAQENQQCGRQATRELASPCLPLLPSAEEGE